MMLEGDAVGMQRKDVQKATSEPDLGRNQLFCLGVDVLERSGAPFWIDQGTLLGIVRDDRLLPWDHDIDLSVWADQVDPNELYGALRNTGLSVKWDRNADCLQAKRSGGPWIDITLYRRRGRFAERRWLVPRDSAWAARARRLKRLLRIAENFYHRGRSRDRFPVRHHIRTGSLAARIAKGAILMLPPSALKASELLLENLVDRIGYRQVRARVPASFYERFDTTRFLNRRVSVPSEVELYLAYKYGEDWRVPKKSWTYWEDDGAIHP